MAARPTCRVARWPTVHKMSGRSRAHSGSTSSRSGGSQEAVLTRSRARRCCPISCRPSASLASIAPWGAPGLDYFAGMGELNAEDIQLSIEDPAAGRAKCEQDRVKTLALSAEELHGHLRTLLSPPDAAVLTGELGVYLVAARRSGLAPGSDGWWADSRAFLTSPWGFTLESIRTPVLLRHGREDRFVPFGHGEWLADHIPGVEAVLHRRRRPPHAHRQPPRSDPRVVACPPLTALTSTLPQRSFPTPGGRLRSAARGSTHSPEA